MKTICFAAVWMVFLIVGALPVKSRAQTTEGYTFISGAAGPQVCLGNWVPSRDVALPGVCEGQIVDMVQFAAISARLSSDKLDQLLLVLSSIDQRLAVNNDQLNRLIDVTANTQTSIDEQVGEPLQDTIARRFDALPREVLANDAFRKELEKLKEDILREVEKRYLKRPATSAK